MKRSHDFRLHSSNELTSHDWAKEFAKLKIYAEQLGYTVTNGTVDEIYFKDKKIIINRNRVPRNRCYVFAHEIGHAHVRNHYRDAFIDRFPGYAYAENTRGRQVSKIEEEVLAWDEAISILRKLNIPIDETAFNRVKQACLGTYLVQ